MACPGAGGGGGGAYYRALRSLLRMIYMAHCYTIYPGEVGSVPDRGGGHRRIQDFVGGGAKAPLYFVGKLQVLFSHTNSFL